MIRGWFYRMIMRIAHRYNWHYAPPIYPENDIQLWCQWCGFRQTIHKGPPSMPGHESCDHEMGLCEEKDKASVAGKQ